MATPALTILDGTGTAKTLAALQDPSSNFLYSVTQDNAQATYRAATSFTPQATAAVTVASLTGSATKTVRIKRVLIGGSATALSSTLFKLIKTSALGAGGTTVTPTVAKLDSGTAAAATAVAQVYTTTLKAAGTAIDGDLTDFQLFQTTVTTPTVAFCEMQCPFPEKGAPTGSAIVLRGASQFLEIQNANGGNLAAGSILQVVFEWVEDAS